MTHNKFGSTRRAMNRPFVCGFTLIEMLIVLAILGLLAAMVGPAVMKQFAASKTKAAKLQIEELSAALDIYKLEMNHYPAAEDGLEALITAPASNQTTWNGPYLRKKVVPLDPWGRQYEYQYPGDNSEFDLYSLGADGQEGGTGENQDIVSWL